MSDTSRVGREKAVKAAERSLEKWDPRQRTLASVHTELWAAATRVVQEYQAAGQSAMVLDLAWRLGVDLNVPGMFDTYESVLRQGGRPFQLWKVAYNEKNLDGWSATGEAIYRPKGPEIEAGFHDYDEALFDFRILTLDTVTSGDFSLEAQVLAEKGVVNFCGLAFGKKDGQNFHGLMLFPGRTSKSGSREGLADSGFIDLASSFGGTSFKTWRHNPVQTASKKTEVEAWHTLRIDVAGNLVDTWFDGNYLATQEFPSSDPLRGAFGLIVGPGQARFRNIRFLSRPARDPAAQIERHVRMEKIEDSGAPPPGGSYQGRIPKFPEVEKWVQGSRKDWKEKGPVPQLLVLWSIQQNDIVRIDEWLRDLADKHAKIGLEIVSIASANDSATLQAYLQGHPLPGAVGVDKREKEGLGDTFETYSIAQFNLPRLILLDVDQKVAWEGDPGFTRGEPWVAGHESFLDTPLADLIEKDKLEVLAGWVAKWNATGAPAITKGDLDTALPLMREARTLPPGRVEAVDQACKKLASVESALDAFPSTAASFTRDAVDPALLPLADYAKVLKKPLDKASQAALAQVKDGKACRDWAEALKRCDKIVRTAKKEEKLAQAQDLLLKLAAMDVRFAKELLAELTPVVEAADWTRFQELSNQAPDRPKKWLLAEYLRW